eukprot:NODE_626_length_2037_cov_19.289235_g578_i0.p1 GENE.NODE_626_length_2037_cov_19.289235_g578_i0~~NODE_626_length_2037_cov_19.289235_g578_i0.p1  ORF type:complete len:605 (+),score=155.52 NODE_626_length_2037_cov_19.289235_g578_i0:123-1937(+)
MTHDDFRLPRCTSEIVQLEAQLEALNDEIRSFNSSPDSSSRSQTREQSRGSLSSPPAPSIVESPELRSPEIKLRPPDHHPVEPTNGGHRKRVEDLLESIRKQTMAHREDLLRIQQLDGEAASPTALRTPRSLPQYQSQHTPPTTADSGSRWSEDRVYTEIQLQADVYQEQMLQLMASLKQQNRAERHGSELEVGQVPSNQDQQWEVLEKSHTIMADKLCELQQAHAEDIAKIRLLEAKIEDQSFAHKQALEIQQLQQQVQSLTRDLQQQGDNHRAVVSKHQTELQAAREVARDLREKLANVQADMKLVAAAHHEQTENLLSDYRRQLRERDALLCDQVSKQKEFSEKQTSEHHSQLQMILHSGQVQRAKLEEEVQRLLEVLEHREHEHTVAMEKEVVRCQVEQQQLLVQMEHQKTLSMHYEAVRKGSEDQCETLLSLQQKLDEAHAAHQVEVLWLQESNEHLKNELEENSSFYPGQIHQLQHEVEHLQGEIVRLMGVHDQKMILQDRLARMEEHNAALQARVTVLTAAGTRPPSIAGNNNNAAAGSLLGFVSLFAVVVAISLSEGQKPWVAAILISLLLSTAVIALFSGSSPVELKWRGNELSG